MLHGKSITLRLVQQSDLGELHEFHEDIANRGQYFPIGVMSKSVFRKKYEESGFWDENSGMLVIEDDSRKIIGHIEFFETVSYLDELEISYHIYSDEHTGKGVATEAVELLANYLFNRKKHNRIRLIIHPENAASIRVAEKCGFKHEGTSRGAWYHMGQSQDVEVFALVRNDYFK